MSTATLSNGQQPTVCSTNKLHFLLAIYFKLNLFFSFHLNQQKKKYRYGSIVIEQQQQQHHVVAIKMRMTRVFASVMCCINMHLAYWNWTVLCKCSYKLQLANEQRADFIELMAINVFELWRPDIDFHKTTFYNIYYPLTQCPLFFYLQYIDLCIVSVVVMPRTYISVVSVMFSSCILLCGFEFYLIPFIACLCAVFLFPSIDSIRVDKWIHLQTSCTSITRSIETQLICCAVKSIRWQREMERT